MLCSVQRWLNSVYYLGFIVHDDEVSGYEIYNVFM